MKITFLGHACFLLESDDAKVVIDPFLSGNPLAPVKPEKLEVDYVLVSHAHADHLGDAVSLARRNRATIISTFEVANRCGQEGAATHAMHVGGKRPFPFGYVRLTPAFHGAGVEGGHACGFVVHIDGHTIYHAGDTGLFGDMKLYGGIVEQVEVALLPIGDNFTMGPEDALLAVEWLAPRLVVPMHYNTWPLIEADPREFKRKVEERTASRVVILAPGEELKLD